MKKDSFTKLVGKKASTVDHLLFEGPENTLNEGGFGISSNGISLPEGDDKCCCILPLKCGVIIIGLGVIISPFFFMLGALAHKIYLSWLTVSLLLACYIPVLPAALFFLLWMCNDSEANRKRLPLACKLVILSYIAAGIWGLVVKLTADNEFIAAMVKRHIWSALYGSVIYGYYTSVCHKLSEK